MRKQIGDDCRLIKHSIQYIYVLFLDFKFMLPGPPTSILVNMNVRSMGPFSEKSEVSSWILERIFEMLSWTNKIPNKGYTSL